MRNANFLGLMTYIMSFGVVIALWNENIYLLFKFSSITLALYLTFIIVNEYEQFLRLGLLSMQKEKINLFCNAHILKFNADLMPLFVLMELKGYTGNLTVHSDWLQF